MTSTIRSTFAILSQLVCLNVSIAQDTAPRDSKLAQDAIALQRRDVKNRMVDTFTGNLKLVYDDVFLRGNGGLDIKVSRVYDTATLGYSQVGWTANGYALSYKWVGLGLGWSINVAPRVVIYPSGSTYLALQPSEDHLCKPSPINQWAQYFVEHLDGRSERLIRLQGGGGRTASNWIMHCATGSEPDKLVSPDGLTHELGTVDSNATHVSYIGAEDVRSLTVKHTTKIIDLSGNWLQIAYRKLGVGLNSGLNPSNWLTDAGDYWASTLPVSILSSDGRSLAFNYDNGVASPATERRPPRLLNISTPQQNLVSFSYEGGKYYDYLKSATYPVEGTISYDYYPESVGTAENPNTVRLKRIYNISGGVTEFSFLSQMYMLCTNLNAGYMEWSDSFRYWNSVATVTDSLGGKQTYSYKRAVAHGELDETIIASPDKTETYKHMGYGYFSPPEWLNLPWTKTVEFDGGCQPAARLEPWKFGLLTEYSVDSLYLESYVWTKRVLSTDYFQLVKGRTYLANPSSESRLYYVPVLATKTIKQDGVRFSTHYSSFDAFGNAGLVVESGPEGSRTANQTFENDQTKNVVGRLKSRSVSQYTGNL